MAADDVRIDQLRLRVPGLGSEAAARLGQDVCRRVAAGLPTDAGPRHLGALQLRVEAPVGTSQTRLAETIASAILERLR
jgi:hypothetical protein